ncbi:MAG: hypothetical protein GC155_03350 [Alphaproteobacteria bacterium]|nr:hypothetical protein [Alphaproteobacteria bacterium]
MGGRREIRIMAATVRGALCGAATVALLFGFGGAARAQIGSSKDPIQISSDKLDAQNSNGQAIYINNVEAVQGDARLKADRLTVLCDVAQRSTGARSGASSCPIKSLVADSNVYYITPDEKIRGDKAEYDYANQVLTITGNPVILSRGDQGVIKGKKVVYDFQTGHATITNEGARVTSIFNTEKQPDTPATPGAAPNQ